MADEKIEKDMEDIEEFIEQEEDKAITQEDSIDPTVEQHMQEMGFLWDRVQRKLKEDSVCFSCKKEMADTDDVHLIEANRVDKGVIAFVSICKECFDEEEAKQPGAEKND